MASGLYLCLYGSKITERSQANIPLLLYLNMAMRNLKCKNVNSLIWFIPKINPNARPGVFSMFQYLFIIPKTFPPFLLRFCPAPLCGRLYFSKAAPVLGAVGPSSFTWNVLARRVGTVGQESSESSANAGIFASPQLGLGTVILRISPVMITIIIYYIITMITIVLSSGQELVQLYLWGLFF